MSKKLLKLLLMLVVVSVVFTACGAGQKDTPTPALSPTPEIPTATPIPMAFTVEGEGVTADEFLAEVEHYKADQITQGAEPTDEEAQQVVLNELIGQALLSQGAREKGFSADEALIQARIDTLIASLGSPEALSQWQAEQGYTEESFRVALKRALEAAWMRDEIAGQVPESREQIHAIQILVFDEELSRTILAKLQSGSDFIDLAAFYDPITGGELGWFPRGYLLKAEIERAAFALQPGDNSDVITTDIGYHIIYIVERESNRPLAPDALQALRARAVEEWLEQKRQQSVIVLAP